MNCAISGAVPDEPVVSVKSGHVFEKRLIEKQIELTGTCPVTGEDLAVEDLIPLKSNPVVRPKAPAATSLPTMLSSFQQEWDALILECYTLKQHVHSLRQELAQSLYRHDAACRVIARLMQERDQARSALADVQSNMSAAVSRSATSASSGASGAAMQIEEDSSGGIGSGVVAKMQETAKGLSKSRKKKVKSLQAEVAKPDVVSGYTANTVTLHSTRKPGILAVDVSQNDDTLVATTGMDGDVIVYNRATGKNAATYKKHKKQTNDVKFHPSNANIVATASSDKTSAVWNHSSGDATVLADHKTAVVACTFHPCGDYLVTATEDAMWNFFDLGSGQLLQSVECDSGDRVAYTSASFHPDGLILGTGADDSVVRVWDVKQQKNVANFCEGHSGGIKSIAFSENGYFLASADGDGVVQLWDLRKLANIQTIQTSAKACHSVAFDASGTYLGVGTNANLQLYQAKTWKKVHEFADHSKAVTGVSFGRSVSFIASVGLDRTLKLYSSA